MNKLPGSENGRKYRIGKWFHHAVIYLACVCTYAVALFCVWWLHHNQSIEACVKIPPVPPPPIVRPDPMVGLRKQCLAAILAKSDEKRWDMIELELSDSRAVCFVAEGMYPKGIVPELNHLPAKSVSRAAKALKHVE